MGLPDDLKCFLSEGRVLEYKASECVCGNVSLLGLEDIHVNNIEVELEEKYYSSKEQLENGPWGHYYIPAVNLIKECEKFEPENILLWLPEQNIYGTYDPHHSWLGIFPNKSWKDIESNPLPYINSQWKDVNRELALSLNPIGKYKIVYEP